MSDDANSRAAGFEEVLQDENDRSPVPGHAHGLQDPMWHLSELESLILYRTFSMTYKIAF